MGIPTGQANLTGLSLWFVTTSNLTFEQQKEMLMLLSEHDKMQQQAEIEKQLAEEKLHYQIEQAKLSIEKYNLDFIKSGKLV